MAKRFYLLFLAMFALAACDAGREINPEEQREIDRQDRQVWRQMSGVYGQPAPSLHIAQYATQRPTTQTAATEY
jgi:hypothetical protein